MSAPPDESDAPDATTGDRSRRQRQEIGGRAGQNDRRQKIGDKEVEVASGTPRSLTLTRPWSAASSLVSERRHRVHARGAERGHEAGAERDHGEQRRRRREDDRVVALQLEQQRLPRGRPAPPAPGPTRRRRASSRPPATASSGARGRARRRAPSAGRSRACAAPRCRRARRRGRRRRAAWPAPRTPPTARVIMRSRKTFSRTCCSIVRRSSTGRFGSRRATTFGIVGEQLLGRQRRPHVEVQEAQRLVLAVRREELRRRRVLHLAVLRVLPRRRRSRCAASPRAALAGCACRRRRVPRLNFFVNCSLTIATVGRRQRRRPA